MSSAAKSAFGGGLATALGAGIGGIIGGAFGAMVGNGKGRLEEETATTMGCVVGAAVLGGLFAAITSAASYNAGAKDAQATPPQIPPGQ